MLRPGSSIPVRFLLIALKLATLFVSLLLILKFLKKKIILNDGLKIYALLQNSGLNETLCKFAAAQSAHETGGFSSEAFKKRNNCFGMYYAGQALATGVKGELAYYKTIEDSVTDFVRWWILKRNKIFSLPLIVNSIDKYVSFLKNNDYFTAPENEYLTGVKHYYNILFG